MADRIDLADLLTDAATLGEATVTLPPEQRAAAIRAAAFFLNRRWHLMADGQPLTDSEWDTAEAIFAELYYLLLAGTVAAGGSFILDTSLLDSVDVLA